MGAGGRIPASLTVVDRMQGGGAVIESLGTDHHALLRVDKGLFDMALGFGQINKGQHKMLLAYVADTKASMQGFIDENPGFIEAAIASGGKGAERARLCIENRIYG